MQNENAVLFVKNIIQIQVNDSIVFNQVIKPSMGPYAIMKSTLDAEGFSFKLHYHLLKNIPILCSIRKNATKTYAQSR